MANIKNPSYGIKLDQDSLTTQDPNAVIYGVTPDNKFIPIKVTSDGALVLGSGITLDAGDLEIGAVEIKNFNTDDRAFVSTNHEVLAQARIYDAFGNAITSTTISGGKQGLDVSITGTPTFSLTLTHTTSDILVYGNDGTNDQKLKTNSSGELQVDVGNFPAFPTTIDIGNLPATQTVDGTVDVGNFPTAPASAAVSSKSRSDSSQTFLSLNASRKGVMLFNNSSALLYVKFGTTASLADFTVRLAANSYYEVPFSYTGRIDGIWASAGTGAVLITELT